jgi:hypothetical protein
MIALETATHIVDWTQQLEVDHGSSIFEIDDVLTDHEVMVSQVFHTPFRQLGDLNVIGSVHLFERLFIHQLSKLIVRLLLVTDAIEILSNGHFWFS